MTIRERAKNKIAAMKKDGWDMSVFEDLLAEIERLERDNRAHCTALMTTAMWEDMEEKVTALEQEHNKALETCRYLGENVEQLERERDEATNDMKKTLHAATLAEREACAKVAEDSACTPDEYDSPEEYARNRTAQRIAAAIRSRK